MLLLALIAACKAPPEAPTEFDELCAWLYEHHLDDDAELCDEGLDNLAAWLASHWQDTSEGYLVSGISDDVADSLDGADRSVKGIFGVAVATESTHPVGDAVDAMVVADQEEVHPSNYSDYGRTYESDPDCFLDQSCDRLEASEDYTATFILGVESHNLTWNQYLWAQEGEAMAHRAWLTEPPEVNFAWLEVADQYYLDVFVPRTGGHRRLQVTWMVYDGDDVPESTVQNLVVTGMRSHSEDIEEWLDEG